MQPDSYTGEKDEAAWRRQLKQRMLTIKPSEALDAIKEVENEIIAWMERNELKVDGPVHNKGSASTNYDCFGLDNDDIYIYSSSMTGSHGYTYITFTMSVFNASNIDDDYYPTMMIISVDETSDENFKNMIGNVDNSICYWGNELSAKKLLNDIDDYTGGLEFKEDEAYEEGTDDLDHDEKTASRLIRIAKRMIKNVQR
jgi:hypothetical protein